MDGLVKWFNQKLSPCYLQYERSSKPARCFPNSNYCMGVSLVASLDKIERRNLLTAKMIFRTNLT